MMKKVIGMLAKNSPQILTGLGAAGVITTAVLSAKATPKALLLMERHVEEVNGQHEIRFFEQVGVMWKPYIPAILMGAVSMACIIGANSIQMGRNAALSSLYALSANALTEYKGKVFETFGKNKALAVQDGIHKDHIMQNPPNEGSVIVTGSGDVLCCDTLTGRYFKSDMESIRRAVNDINRSMLEDDFVSVNDLYDALGLPVIKYGQHQGWSLPDGLVEVSCSAQLTERGEPCLVMDYTVVPKYYK